MRGRPSQVGDTKTAVNGYHYTRTRDRWRLTHHLVAEAKLKRPLNVNERAVFQDGDRTNFDPGNVIIVVKGSTTVARERARIESRIADLRAQLDELNGV